ncbi:MAG: putative dehydrogenase [Mycobacterium sp.]|nr:putative dehydrogenase [Mycobacterium sp.]
MGSLAEPDDLLMAVLPEASRSYPVWVEAGQVAAFRRAVGELEAQPESGAVAPPTFLMAADLFDPEYQRRPRAGQDWPDGANQRAGGGSHQPGGGAGFHAEQTFTYHRHPRAGDVLTATVRPGRRWEKAGRRGGRLLFTETLTDFTDEAGELVATASFVSVGTERVPG